MVDHDESISKACSVASESGSEHEANGRRMTFSNGSCSHSGTHSFRKWLIVDIYGNGFETLRWKVFSFSFHLRHLSLIQHFFDPWQHHHTITGYNMTI